MRTNGRAWLAVVVVMGALAVLVGCGDEGAGQGGTAVTGPDGAEVAPVTGTDLAGVERLVAELDAELQAFEAELNVTVEGDLSVGGAPGGVQEEDQRFEMLRRRGLAEIDRRIATLTEAMARVQAAPRLTGAHRTELGDQLEGQRSELTALRAKVTGARRLVTLRSALGKVVTDYRVYVLTVPKTRGVGAADIVLAALDRMGGLSGRLEATVAAVDDEDVEETATADLEALTAELGQTRVKVENLATTLLALQAASYPANRPTLESARSDLRDARTSLEDCAALADQIVTALDD